jgi:cytochrome c oxidase subunit 1
MFLTGMGTAISTFFQLTTMIISVPSIIILTVLIISLWGGSIRFSTPMLFALAFIPMFGIGGLTGLPLGLSVADIHLHDTYYVIGHFHFVVAPGTLMALFAGIYYWYPKVTGRRMNDTLGRWHFWPTLIGLNGVFLPMFLVGMAGVSRRLYDGGTTYAHAQDVLWLNEVSTVASWLLAAAQVVFVINFFLSLRNGKKVEDNPWQATTLEWATTSPPLGHGNFASPVTVHRGPYEYSVPEASNDFSPQHQEST